MNSDRINLQAISSIPFAGAVLAGVVLCLFVDCAEVYLSIVVFVCLIAVASTLIIKQLQSYRIFALLLFFVSIGWFRADVQLGRDQRWDVYNCSAVNDTVKVTGRVLIDASGSRDLQRITLDQVLLENEDYSLQLDEMRIRLFGDEKLIRSLESGDIVYAVGRVRSSSERSARFTGLLTGILARREVADVYVDSGSLFIQHTDGYLLRRTVDSFRRWIIDVFNSNLSLDAASLCRALVLGDREDFGYRFTEQLRLTGLSHIFALSGLNTGLIISLLWFVLGFLFIPRNARYILLLLAALFYMELGREVPSLVRATLMCSVFLIGQLLQRRTLVINYLAIAMLIELLWRPMDIVDPGFALSYLSVLGMIAGYSVLKQAVRRLIDERKSGVIKSLTEVVVGTLTAQAGTIPLTGFLFHRIPLLGGLGNLIVVPGFAVMLVLASLMLFLAGVTPFLLQFITPAIEWLSYSLGLIVDFFARLPLSGMQISTTSLSYVVVIYLLIFSIPLLWLFNKRRIATTTLLLLACAIVWTGIWGNARISRLTFIDVGNGDACLIESGTKRILVDAGPRYGEWSAAHIILPYMADRGIAHLDGLILTHPDNDHIGGAADLLNRLDIDRLWSNGDSSSSRAFVDLQVVSAAQGKSISKLKAGDVLRLTASTKLTVVTPDSLSLLRTNESNPKSLAMILTMDSSTAFLSGDIDSTVERELLSWGEQMEVDLLHAGHHGSKGSSSYSFLYATRPDLCILTAGRRNIYGHPAPEVLERLKSVNIPYLITGEESTLVFESAGNGWKRVKPEAQTLSELWKLPYG